MQKIKLVCIGSIKEKFYTDAINEYKKRLQRFCDFEIVELPEFLPPSKCNDEQIKGRESEEILKVVSGFVVVLDLNGKEISSEQLAQVIKERSITSDSKVTFVIGGSLGLSNEVVKRANLLVRAGKMTFPHQLMRVMLTEQIYRAMTINNNVKYHK